MGCLEDSTMQPQLNNLKERAVAIIAQTGNLDELEALRVRFLGRKGELTALLQGLPQLAEDERRPIGVLANQVKEQITHAIELRKKDLETDRFATLAET